MKDRIRSYWQFVKLHKKKSIVIVLGVLFVLYKIFGGEPGLERELAVVEKRELIQEVSATGNVVASVDVDLAFERSGKVYSINVAVGDVVEKGDAMASLVGSELAAQRNQAAASVQSAQAVVEQFESALAVQVAKLDELNNSPRPEQIVLAQTKVTNAELAVADAQNSLAVVQAKADSDLGQVYEDIKDVLDTAYTKSNDAVVRLTDALFTSDATTDPKVSFVVVNASALSTAQLNRVRAGQALLRLQAQLVSLPADPIARANELQTALTELNTVRDYFVSLTHMMAYARGIDDATLATYHSNVNTGFSTVVTQVSAVLAQQQLIATQKITNDNTIAGTEISLTTAENALATAKKDQQLVLAGPAPQQVVAQQAAVDQAAANLKSQRALLNSSYASLAGANALLSQTIIRAPIAGIVTKQEMSIGEIVQGQTIVLGIIADAEFEVETFVPEVDIAKIEVDDVAEVTLDAYGVDEYFAAQVIAIDPAETVIDGLSTYRVRLQFNEQDERIRSGMTANIDIATDRRDDVIAIPQRAIIRKDEKKLVRVITHDEEYEEVEVEVGLRGSDGFIEIVNGLEEGKTIIVFIDEK